MVNIGITVCTEDGLTAEALGRHFTGKTPATATRKTRPGCTLEDHPETELNVARRSQRGGDNSRLCVADGCVRQIELRVVEHIKQLSAELYVYPLRNSNILEQRSVQIKPAGTSE